LIHKVIEPDLEDANTPVRHPTASSASPLDLALILTAAPAFR